MNARRMTARILAPAALAVGITGAATQLAGAEVTGPHDVPQTEEAHFSTALNGIELSEPDDTGARVLTVDAEVCVEQAPYASEDGLTRVSPEPWSMQTESGERVEAFWGFEGSEGYDAFETRLAEGDCQTGEIDFLVPEGEQPATIQYWNELGEQNEFDAEEFNN